MRRGLGLVLLFSALGTLAPAAFGQYPYPAAPMYGQPMYGPQPMYGQPMYGPQPMYGRPQYGPPMYGPPMYAPPAMMPMPYHPARPNVIVYGPLTDPDAPRPRTMTAAPAPAPAPTKAPGYLPELNAAKKETSAIKQVQATTPARAVNAKEQPQPTTPKASAAKSGVVQAQNTTPRTIVEAVGIRRTQYDVPEACGSGDCNACPAYGPCDYGPGDPIYGNPPAPLRGHGRWLGEVGAYFLLPYVDSRLAYTSTTPGFTGNNDFPRGVNIGPRGSLGYLFHTGWGLRGNYWYLEGSVSTSLNNTDPNTQIVSALEPPFFIGSPSVTLLQGIGTDQFNFTQRLQLHVADFEVLKECQWMDTTFLFSLGARYSRIQQSYAASRNNPGGSNGLLTVSIDREDVGASSHFEGWGPTGSMELVHRLGKSDVSFYTNVRGSILFGVNRFNRDYNAQLTVVDNNGVPFFGSITDNNLATDRRVVTIGEVEAGLQYGVCLGRAYLYGRAGFVCQRWWDVGSPISADGSLNFLGGTARVGITY